MTHIAYLNMPNPDDRELKRASSLLSQGRLVVLPSDTNWKVVANLYSPTGIEALYKWSKQGAQHHYAVLCHDVSQAAKVAQIEDHHYRYMRPLVPGHFTFIFQASKLARKLLKASKTDHQVGIRIPSCKLFHALSREIDFPLLSTKVDPAHFDKEHASEIYSMLIAEEWPYDLDMVLDPGEYEFQGPSSMIEMGQEGITVLRP